MDYMIGIHITVIISVLLLIRLAFPRKFGNVPIVLVSNLAKLHIYIYLPRIFPIFLCMSDFCLFSGSIAEWFFQLLTIMQ